MPKRYDVYLSSTKADLGPERELVAQIITGEHKWTLNESYSASHRPTLDSCLQDVEDSHVYLCIVGARYGGLAVTGAADDPKWSYTQHEFEHATKLGIPRFVFFKEGGFGLADVDADRAAIDAFRARITGADGVRPAQFRSESELRSALNKCRDEMKERLGADPHVHAQPRVVGRPWEMVFHRLMTSLSPAPASRWREIDAGLTELLGFPDLALLAPYWAAEWMPEMADDGAPDAVATINRLTGILENFVADRVSPATGSRERQDILITLLKLLVALAPNETAWNASSWGGQNEPVRFRSPELMCAIRSITRRRGFDLTLNRAEQSRSRLNNEWMLDLDGPEFGAGVDRLRAIQDQVGRRFCFQPNSPRLEDGRLCDDDVESLAVFVANRQDIERRLFALTELVADGAIPDRQLLEVARELELTAIPRKHVPTDLLRANRERFLEDAVCQCLTAIGKLP